MKQFDKKIYRVFLGGKFPKTIIKEKNKMCLKE